MRIDFDFVDLEAFLAVKETGSFQDAGARLNLSQSSVSRRIQKLEEALGSTLFERTTRNVRPTLAAKRLQLRAEAILQEALETTHALRDETAAYAHQRLQTVTIATIPSVMGHLVGPALRKASAAGNRSRVRLLDLAANEVAEAVAQGEADFGICSVPMLEPTTTFDLLYDEPIVLAVPQDNAFAERPDITWRDLRDASLILPARGTGNRLVIDEALARSRNPVRWTYEVSRTTTALEMVAQGIGVAPIPQGFGYEAQARGVACIDIRDPGISRPIGIVRRLGVELSPSVRVLHDAIAATAKA